MRRGGYLSERYQLRLVESGSVSGFGLRVPFPRRTLQMPSVREPTVGSRKGITAQADRDDLVDLGAAVQVGREGLVDRSATDPAVVFLCQYATAELVTFVSVGSSRVGHGSVVFVEVASRFGFDRQRSPTQ